MLSHTWKKIKLMKSSLNSGNLMNSRNKFQRAWNSKNTLYSYCESILLVLMTIDTGALSPAPIGAALSELHHNWGFNVNNEKNETHRVSWWCCSERQLHLDLLVGFTLSTPWSFHCVDLLQSGHDGVMFGLVDKIHSHRNQWASMMFLCVLNKFIDGADSLFYVSR